MDVRTVLIPSVGKEFRLVPREQMRIKTPVPTLTLPTHLKGLAEAVPTPPAAFDWSKGGTLDYPVLGNDRVGDCYYAAACHGSQTYTGNASTECGFDAQAVVNRYLRISGGDNGLSDSDIFPEWKAGIVGPNGPRKILDYAVVRPTDDAAINLSAWAFGGLIYTCALLDTWLRNPKPGDTWDASGRPDPGAGHAMYITGKNGRAGLDTQTWGFKPPINLTLAGMRASDPELVVVFSLDQFNSKGICAFTGLSYEDKATLWTQLGGRPLPPSPFGPPPPPPPMPGPAKGIEVFQAIPAGNYQLLSIEQRNQITESIVKLLAVLPSDNIAVVPMGLQERLSSGMLTFGKLLKIVLLLLATIESGPLTPEKLLALVAAINAIIEGP